MNAEQLKNSILQRAIEGKLVAQREEEGTAAELLREIKAEKARLVKEGKLKKEKPLRSITAEEIPFEIPESWEWVRLGDLLNSLTDGTHKTPKYTASGVPFLSVKNMSSRFLSFENTKFISQQEHEELTKRCHPQKGDMLLSKVGTTGIPVIIDTDKDFSIFVSIALLKYSSYIYAPYLLRAIESPHVQEQCKLHTRGVGNKNWVLTDIANTTLPLPPLAEQKRIVAKIEELLPHVERYGKAHDELTALNAKFPEAMKKSVLQYAMEGRIVEQRAEEGTAKELLKEIRAEKARLVKEGKLKKEKPLPEIKAEEMTFEIPESWEWVRLCELGWFSSGKTPAMHEPKNWQNGTIPWITSKDMKAKYLVDSQMKITEQARQGMTTYPAGTLLFVVRSGILKRTLPICILTMESTINQDIKAYTLFNNTMSDYLYYMLKGLEPHILLNYTKRVTTVDSLKFDEFSREMPVPLPPLAEQKRIVAKIEELLAYCGALEK